MSTWDADAVLERLNFELPESRVAQSGVERILIGCRDDPAVGKTETAAKRGLGLETAVVKGVDADLDQPRFAPLVQHPRHLDPRQVQPVADLGLRAPIVVVEPRDARHECVVRG